MTVYFDRNGVRVDSSKLVAGGVSYPLGNISTYTVARRDEEVFKLGEAIYSSLFFGVPFSAIATFLLGFSVPVGIAGGAAVAWAIFAMAKKRDRYYKKKFHSTVLELTSSGSSKHAIVVHDEDDTLCYEVSKALDAAIDARG